MSQRKRRHIRRPDSGRRRSSERQQANHFRPLAISPDEYFEWRVFECRYDLRGKPLTIGCRDKLRSIDPRSCAWGFLGARFSVARQVIDIRTMLNFSINTSASKSGELAPRRKGAFGYRSAH